MNGGKKHKSEPKRLRFVRETTYGPEGRGFESLTAYQKSSKSSDFGDFCFVLTKATPGYAGGEKELIARGGVDKKKSPS